MPKRNLAWILVVVMIALLMWRLPQTIAGRDSVYRAFGPLVDVRAQIHKRAVAEIDDENLVARAVDAGIEAMIASLNDPYAVYFTEEEYARFNRRTEGRFGGIGVDVAPAPDGLEVLSREPGSPAERAGILPGDIITHIDGRDLRKTPFEEAVNNLLNGAPDTPVRLTVRTPASAASPEGVPDPAPRDLRLRRAEIQIDPIRGWSRDSEGHWRFMLDPERRIGYVRLTKFMPDTLQRLDHAVDELIRQGVRGLVLDLRENSGGLLDSARDVADRFLAEGLIVSTRGRRTDGRQWFAAREGTYPAFKMTVLINGASASAAEIVAGALRDNRRAEVVGERSFGKGSVQEVIRIEGSNGAIKLTTALYYLPNGECIHRTLEAARDDRWGVEPTIPVKLTPEQRRAWLAAWHDVGRQPTPAPASRVSETQPVPGKIKPDDSGADETAHTRFAEEQLRREAARLLEADDQLRAALDLLLRRLDSPRVTSPQPGPHARGD